MTKNKKAFSPVITTLIIISVSLLSIGFVWIVVKNIVQDGAENVSLNKLVLSAKIEKISINNTSNDVKLTLKRNSEIGRVTGVKFIFSDGMNTEIIEMDASLKELERKDFEIHLEELSVSDLEAVSAALVSESDSGNEIIGEASYVEVNKGNSQEIAEANEEGASLYELGPGDYNFSLLHEGRIRRYKVHVPESYDRTKETPVVIYLHGGGGSSEGAENEGLYSYSDKYGFILVAPAGTGVFRKVLLTWNGGEWEINGKIENCCGYAAENNIDDVGFISKVIDKLDIDFNIDDKRVFVTGISNGGIMAYRLACELSDKVSAVAPVAPPAVPKDCNPVREVPVMHIHGTADPCAPYNGGTGGGCLGEVTYEMMSAEQMVNKWKSIDSCSESSSTSYQKGDASCISYSSCSRDAEVEFCTINGMGHTYPNGSQYLPEEKIGPVSSDLSFDQIWEFFERNSLR